MSTNPAFYNSDNTSVYLHFFEANQLNNVLTFSDFGAKPAPEFNSNLRTFSGEVYGIPE